RRHPHQHPAAAADPGRRRLRGRRAQHPLPREAPGRAQGQVALPGLSPTRAPPRPGRGREPLSRGLAPACCIAPRRRARPRISSDVRRAWGPASDTTRERGSMRFRQSRLATVVLGGLVATAVPATVPAQSRTAAPRPAEAAGATVGSERPWAVAGGDIGIRWNHDLAADLGMRILPGSVLGQRASDGSERFSVSESAQMRFMVGNGYARQMADGALQARGGYVVQLRGGDIDLDNFRLVPRRGKPGAEPEYDLVGADGQAWFHVDHVMHELLDDPPSFTIGSSDIRISDQLARRLGAPWAAGLAIAELQLDAPVVLRGSGDLRPASNQITWDGDPAPDGGTYQNDIFMLSTYAQFSRCQGCTGNDGSGTMVITPSATLKNNVNEGSLNPTVAGDPLGTSSVRWTATIPWYQKFTAPSPPYYNDQHPY